MNRFLVASLVIGIVAGCGSSGSAASPGPVMTADGTWSGAAGTADGVDDMQPEP